ncbi:hypothetical protein [Nocardia sp. 348MFTsu5.1]|uniref:hypothetical protein n=1 Tax=Nocardia sp. 348MFTsu5.1 TaxID=1172185 RepID=UPI0003772F8A|nr:hypothetical protein [Nocardia sp. 348MFTsu5.1]
MSDTTIHPSPVPVEYVAPLASPTPSGLWRVATGPLRLPEHAWSGIAVKPVNAGGGFGTWEMDPCYAPLDPDARKDGERPAPLEPFFPLVTWGFDECDPQETDEQVLVQARQNQRLGEPTAVEADFAARLMIDAVDLGSVADIVGAVSVLEAAMAGHRQVGVLHAGAQWAGAAHRDKVATGSPIARSPLGHSWAFGGGYVAGLGDTLVITGPVTIWTGPVFERTAVDPYKNVRSAVVERAVAVSYEALAYRVAITAAV